MLVLLPLRSLIINDSSVFVSVIFQFAKLDK